MKKVILSIILSLTIVCLGLFISPITAKASSDTIDIPTIAEENNLATWKYDWNVVGIGAANPNFDQGHLRFENINGATSNYALYHTNKFNSFRLDMYANLSLPCPSDLGYAGNDWSNLYITFFIDYDDAKAVDNVAMAACPWTNNKGWLSVCFERVSGHTKTEVLINEAFRNDGGTRHFINEASIESKTNWNDGQYHWYTITARSTQSKVPSKAGTEISVYIDGKKEVSYFQSEVFQFDNNVIVPFSTTKGYLGFWASSSLSAGLNTADTNVFVDIQQLQITSYDVVDEFLDPIPEVYSRCPRPQLNLNANLEYSPQASYEVGEDVEIKLSELFTYDGDDALSYEVTLNGEKVGRVNNGYFIWTPEEKGTYTFAFKAQNEDGLTTINDVRLRVVEPEVGPSNPPVVDPGEKEQESKGCKSTMGLGVMSILGLASIFIIKRKKN